MIYDKYSETWYLLQVWRFLLFACKTRQLESTLHCILHCIMLHAIFNKSNNSRWALIIWLGFTVTAWHFCANDFWTKTCMVQLYFGQSKHIELNIEQFKPPTLAFQRKSVKRQQGPSPPPPPSLFPMRTLKIIANNYYNWVHWVCLVTNRFLLWRGQ